MSETSQLQFCDQCGAVLSGYGADRLCAPCLLESAILQPNTSAGEGGSAAPLLVLKDYELLEEIARGGMGVVYRGRQISLNRPVAIKMILGGHLVNTAEIKRFRAEAEIAAHLQHPNIVAIHEVGEHAGQPFFSMDLVEGRNLGQLVRDEPLSSHKAASYLKTISEAVHYAHSRGVLHRDLKPSNVLIDEKDQPRVTDFGLAKRLSGTQNSELTQTGQVLGSPSFIPPEQAAGQKHAIGPASDVYSLGAILYHLLTGRPPFLADSVPATLRMAAESEPVAPRLLNPTIPRDLETICLKCLEKDPLRRYGSASELAEELGRFLRDEPIQARPASTVERARRWVRRKPALASAMALVLVVAIGSPIAAIRINHERLKAEVSAKKAQLEAAKSVQTAKFLREILRSAGPSVARGRDAALFREMLEATSERVGKEIAGQPEVHGDIYATVGSAFMDIGDHRRAVTNLELAVKSYRMAQVGDHPNLARALGMLGFCQSFTEDVANGNKNAKLGLEMARKCNDKETQFTCLLNYSGSFKAWGMGSPEAEPYEREALELKKQMGNDPVGLAIAMRGYSGFLTNAEEKEQMLRNALDLFQKHLPGHPHTVQAAFSLGQMLVGHEKYVEAEQVLKEALHGFHKTHDPNHPYQSIVLRYFVYALLGQNKMKEAEMALREHVETFPENINYYLMLARFRMEHGSLVGATEALPRDLQVKLEKGEFSVLWAVSLLQVGANEKFQEYRRRYLDAALKRGDFHGKLDPAKILLLSAGNDEDVDRSCLFAQKALTNVSEIELFSAEEVRALLDFRHGQFATAKEWATTVAKREDGWKPRTCEGWLIRALASAELQLPALARHALAEGQRILRENRPEGKEAYLFMGDQWALARYLANQASNAVASLPEGSGPFELKDPADFDALVRLGRWDEARAAIDKALTQGSNTNSLPFADTLNDFANQSREAKRYDDAAAIGEQALKIRLRLASTNLSLLIETYGGLAATLDIAKKYSNAAPLLEQRLKLIRSLHGSEGLQVSDALGWNAWVYFKDTRFPEEESALQERLAIQKRHFGSDHTNLLETLDRLGSNLETQGRLQEAEAFRRHALAICEKHFGRDNPGAFNAGAKLSSILLKQRKSAEAQALEQLLALQVERLITSSATSTNVPAVIEALGGLCYTREHTGKYALAEALLEKRLALQRNFYGNEHKDVLDSLGWMAEIRSWGGKPAEAAEVLQKKIEIQTKLFGRENTNVLGNLEWQANLYEDAGKWEQSAPLREELLAVRTKSLGNDHPKAISALAKLCSLRVKQNNLAGAQTLCNELVSRAPESDATWSALTGLLDQTGDWKETVLKWSRLTECKPETAILCRRRAEILGRNRQWDTSIKALTRAIEIKPDEHEFWHLLAPILVETGQHERYRQNCRDSLERFAATKDPIVAERISKDCLILPGSGANLETISAMTDLALNASPTHWALPYFQFCKGFAEYRLGRFLIATEWLQKVLAVHGDWSREVEVHLVLAMSEFQLGKKDEAHRALTQALTIQQAYEPKPETRDLGSRWTDWLIVHALMRESHALIEGISSKDVSNGALSIDPSPR